MNRLRIGGEWRGFGSWTEHVGDGPTFSDLLVLLALVAVILWWVFGGTL